MNVVRVLAASRLVFKRARRLSSLLPAKRRRAFRASLRNIDSVLCFALAAQRRPRPYAKPVIVSTALVLRKHRP